jgi:Fuc2NAc and GlcNAc transferase
MMVPLLLTLLLSALACGLYLRLARRLQLLDRPNDRSSHRQPTPHGGGVPLLLSCALGMLLCRIWSGPWPDVYPVFMLAALLLMLVGVRDDLRGLSVGMRMSAYTLLSLVMAVYLLSPLWSGGLLIIGGIMGAIVLLWSLNLYNFMDGIDGIAAIQCILACGSAALLSWGSGAAPDYPLFCLLLAASHLGFLVWNWPPARLFMGDAGSVPTGFLLAALAILGGVQGQLDPLCWLILLAAFVTDATWTLLWRMFSGQRFLQPHRLHAYQRVSRYWGSHLPVDLGLVALNALWLFPLAWCAQVWPDVGFLLVILAYLPLLVGMAKIRGLA